MVGSVCVSRFTKYVKDLKIHVSLWSGVVLFSQVEASKDL